MEDLRILLIEITQKCNAACDHCGSRCDINSQEKLSADDILNALRDVKDNIGTDVMINISGGEPLMRLDLFDITAEIHSMGFDWGMVTNGTLINDEVIEKMKATGMRTITVSVDGLAENHEKLRHLPGSFERIMDNLKKLKSADFLDCLQVTFTSNKQNYRDFPGLYERLKAIGIDSIRTSFVDPIGRMDEHKELLMGRAEMQYMIDFVNSANKAGELPIEWGCCHYLGNKLTKRHFFCFAGIYAASILYNGDIFVCPNVPRRPELIQGNIKHDQLSQVWKEGFKYFRNRPLPDSCKDCSHKEQCQGDSLHTFNFENGRPNFCYKEIFESGYKAYEKWLIKHYGNIQLCTISSDESAPKIYLEPDAYDEIRNYFHMGSRHPLSLYEQQMGLVGFKIDNDYVIRYVFPSYINSLAGDLATFTPSTLKHAEKCTSIIKKNLPFSDDQKLPGGSGIKFLGFIHSHPLQEELCYSVGDEVIHKRLYKKYGDYIGILVNPEHDLIGAYVGYKKIIQGELKIAERK